MITKRHLVLPGEPPDRPSDTHSVEPIDQVREALANAYEVEAEIGRGGMGRVYLACDRRHRRPVAIKVLHAEVATAMGRDRFLREIAIAASLVHPNILPLYDSGSIGGLLYYVMPYVEGESLRARLEREGQLRLQDATAIAGDVAAALNHAHGRGIVHRDVKPENILLLSGRAVLADFGLAMTAEGKRRTLPGYVVGTPAYMSPEQGAPGGQVDARADIYALGCVVYEMLAGEPPFPAATTRAVLIRHAVDPVPSLRTLRPGISPELEQALFSALAKSPSERPAEAGRFAAALARARVAPWSPPRRLRGLRRMLPLVGLLLVASLPLALELPPHSDARAAGAVGRRLSVEVFANRTGDPTLDPFGELVREWLSGALAASRVVEVDLSSPSTRTPVARGRPTGNRTAGVLPTDLRVAGSYFRAGSGIALHATITNLRSGRVTFAAEPVHLDLENPGPGLARLREELIRRLTTPP